MDNKFIFTSESESRLIVSERDQIDRKLWTSNLQIIYSNQQKGFRIGNQGKVLSLILKDKNVQKRSLTWETETEANKGTVFQLMPVADREDQPYFYIELVSYEKNRPRVIIDQASNEPIVVLYG